MYSANLKNNWTVYSLIKILDQSSVMESCFNLSLWASSALAISWNGNSTTFPEILVANGALAYPRISWKVDNLTRYTQIFQLFPSDLIPLGNFSIGSFAMLKFRNRPHYDGEIWKQHFHSDLRIKFFPSTLCRRNLQTRQSSVILDSFFKKKWAGKSFDYRQ